jgi:hypothetical protein
MAKMQGSYVYTCDGILAAGETWSIETAQDLTQTIVSVRDASQFGAHVTVQATVRLTGDGDYRFFHRAALDGPVLKSVCYFVRNGDIYFQFDGQDVCQIDVAPPYVFFPLMRIFTAKAIKDTIKLGGQAVWVVPDIATLDQTTTVFAPHLTSRAITPDLKEANAYYLSGGPYQSPAHIRLRPEDGLLESYSFTPVGSEAHWMCRYISDES